MKSFCAGLKTKKTGENLSRYGAVSWVIVLYDAAAPKTERRAEMKAKKKAEKISESKAESKAERSREKKAVPRWRNKQNIRGPKWEKPRPAGMIAHSRGGGGREIRR